MPRFHFCTVNGDVTDDLEGTDLSEINEARIEAARMFGQILRDHPERIWSDGKLRVRVQDETGAVIFEIGAVIEPRPNPDEPKLQVKPYGRDCAKRD